MNSLFYTALAFCALVLSDAVLADVLPKQLTGVWATDKSDLKSDYLFAGQAIYFDTDGVGAIVGGPPPIGYRIVAKYNSDKNIILFQVTENGQAVGNGSVMYDPTTETIIDPRQKTIYHRRSQTVTSDVRKRLGLENKAE